MPVAAVAVRVALVVLVALGALGAAGAHAAKPFVDTKKRFEVTLESGWQIAPLPGDIGGMNFQKKLDGVPANLLVNVRVLKAGETTKQTLDELEEAAKLEIGYQRGGDLPSTVGGMPAMRRSWTVFASGDASTVRAVEVYALHAFGHAHVLYFETLETKRDRFAKDVERMLASYVPLAGKNIYAPLAGNWINTSGGPDLTLDEDGRFKLGPLAGGWQADGGKLVLTIPEGGESYRYVIAEDALTLSSPNLGEDMKFRRSATSKSKVAPTKDKPDDKRAKGPLTQEDLIGHWKVLDGDSDTPLTLVLAASGSVQFGPMGGRWRFSTGRLTIRSTAGVTITYAASMQNDGKLVLSGGDLDKDLTLARE